MLASIERAPLTGRQRELELLRERLRRAAQGAGGGVVLAGEAGIGKSRLIAEARALAEDHRFLVLQGRCFEHDRSLPYAPVVDLLRALLRRRPDEASPRAPDGIPPELRRLLPELAGSTPQAVEPSEPELEQRRLMQAIATFLLGFAGERPRLLVFEDLHWSDDATIDLLHRLARQIEGQRVLLLLSYRNDEAHEALAHLLAELERERLAVELPLGRLATGEVDALLRGIFGQRQPVRRDFLQAIYELTEGNPFF
ncbi:MAG TPA: AAA family ATPase, partial [Dehalococcoidia bacterium]|nr:AAA family ATPase [Dehalococcoidia bacterium]